MGWYSTMKGLKQHRRHCNKSKYSEYSKAHPCFHGKKWYDWALVQFEENNKQGDLIENHYPSQILGCIY